MQCIRVLQESRSLQPLFYNLPSVKSNRSRCIRNSKKVCRFIRDSRLWYVTFGYLAKASKLGYQLMYIVTFHGAPTTVPSPAGIAVCEGFCQLLLFYDSPDPYAVKLRAWSFSFPGYVLLRYLVQQLKFICKGSIWLIYISANRDVWFISLRSRGCRRCSCRFS